MCYILSYQGLRLSNLTSKGRYDETFAGKDVSVNAVKETCANVILAFYMDHASFYTHLYINQVLSLRVRTKKIFLISQPEHILWVLKRTVCSFVHPKP